MTENHHNRTPELLGSDVSIRPINADDLPQIIESTYLDPVIAEKWGQMLETGDMDMLVVYKDGVPAGRVNIIWTGAEEQSVIDEIGIIPTVNSLRINQKNRGQGLGWQIMTACEDLVRSHSHPENPPRLALGVKPDNKPARKLYEKLGYRYYKVAGHEYFVSASRESQNGVAFIDDERCLLRLLMVKNRY